MKKLLSFIFCSFFIIGLVGCNAVTNKESSDDIVDQVSYQVTKRYIEHNTGDITIDDYTYDEEGNLLSTKLYLNDKFQSSVEYDYNKDLNLTESMII